MGTLTIPSTWATGKTLTEADLDGIKNTMEKFLNETGVSDDNLSDSAAFVASNLFLPASITNPKFEENAITQAKRAAKNIQEGGTAYATKVITANTYTDVCDSVSITTKGRPVLVFMNSVGGASDNYVSFEMSTTPGAATVTLFRDTTTSIASWAVRNDENASHNIPMCGFMYIDHPAAGTYTYLFQAKVQNAAGNDDITFVGADITAMEL